MTSHENKWLYGDLESNATSDSPAKVCDWLIVTVRVKTVHVATVPCFLSVLFSLPVFPVFFHLFLCVPLRLPFLVVALLLFSTWPGDEAALWGHWCVGSGFSGN